MGVRVPGVFFVSSKIIAYDFSLFLVSKVRNKFQFYASVYIILRKKIFVVTITILVFVNSMFSAYNYAKILQTD